jgi:N-acetylglucosamine-6-phosphate deacetylase
MAKARSEPVIDADGRYLTPGFIDLHMHGVMGLQVDDGPDNLDKICSILPQFGVTGFLPSLTPMQDTVHELRNLSQYAAKQYTGSSILGFFLEGHFLALAGALSLVPIDHSCERVVSIIESLKPYPVVFGVSPELPGLTELLPHMTAEGIPAFITHTRASVNQTEQAIKAGATHATHFYNVFPYPGDQEPGVRGCGAVEAVLASKVATVDFILDGEHVDPIAVKMALRVLGSDRVCLITDSNINAGLPPGTYTGVGGQQITVAYAGAPARLGPGSQWPGGLIGSGMTMDLAVRHACEWLDVSLPQAVAMASANPAEVLGIGDRKGMIEPGYDADMLLLDDRLQVTNCWIGGRPAYGIYVK